MAEICDYGRAEKFLLKQSYLLGMDATSRCPDRIYNNPSVGFADSSLYTREPIIYPNY
ncbi:MAG: hypothetical protein ACI4Q8_03440 [Ruminococcus sp.]